MEYKRPIFTKLRRRLHQSGGLIQVITGPRQVGKTTLVKQLFELEEWEGIYQIAEGSAKFNGAWIESVFNDAVVHQKSTKKKVILAIDEIQKIQNWSESIKTLFDRQKFEDGHAIELLLLGSSDWLMQRGLSESLAGRFEQWKIPHWSYVEMHDAFDITPEEYVYFGAYPGAIKLREDEDRWKSYVLQALIETVITKDVLLMERIDKPAVLRRVFELGALYSGQILSYTKLMGQLQDAKNTTTVAHYLELLHRAGLLDGLQKFAMDNARKRASSPKWQVMNNALLSAISHERFEGIQKDKMKWGRWVESAVGCHLISHLQSDMELFYWNESNAEVDYILKYGDRYIGLEVKTSPEKITGLEKFSKKFRPHKIYQLSPTGLSWQKLLQMDPRELF
ncbi:MAG: ATP-binding protein [Flavobacteriales bacterium]|nr:ATP-binding protein [Flavobacteriales bacterium]